MKDSAYNILQMCKNLSTLLSFEGLFLPGGISTGRHYEQQDQELNASFLCSEALQEAYDLESKHAVYPRILIHEKVVDDLSGMGRSFVAKDLDYQFLHFSPQLVHLQGDNLGAVKRSWKISMQSTNLAQACVCKRNTDGYFRTTIGPSLLFPKLICDLSKNTMLATL